MAVSPQEQRKRKREKRIAILIAIGFVGLTLFQALITGKREGYQFVQSLLYFALLHLNVILIMALVFLVSRNLIKAYLLRKSGKLGSSLRWKLVTSLLGFSILPSVLLFVGSSYVLRQGFDRWFGNQVASALEDAQGIAKVHYDGIESSLDFYGQKLAVDIKAAGNIDTSQLKQLAQKFPIEALELYVDLSSPPLRWLREDLPDWTVPRAAGESLSRAFQGERFHLIRQYGDGDLVQQFFPLGQSRLLVLSQTVPLGLKTRITELQTAFQSYRKTRLLKDSLKTNYTLILLTLFVLILFVVSWFGLYMAKTVTEPVAELMKATEEFREGRWSYRISTEADPIVKKGGGVALADLEVLKGAFNLMAEEVGRRGHKLEEANAQLISLVGELEERERYLEILLSSIRRGVLVLDSRQRIQRINLEAVEFGEIHAETKDDLAKWVGMDWREVFPDLGLNDEALQWLDEATMMRGQPVDRIFDTRKKTPDGDVVLNIRATGIQLLDERQNHLGWMIILEDVSDAARLERLAAWQEVAKRVAHEIKNPLTPIQISADRMARRLRDKFDAHPEEAEIFRESIAQIQKQVRVIRDLVREFSQFAKLPEPKLQKVNFPELVEDILSDYRFNHAGVKFELKVPQESIGDIHADQDYMRRLVVNLTDNAIHSMEEAQTQQPTVTIEFSLPQPGWLNVSFVDNGPGVSAALREKIFDPYITSKASGLGLGLPIVRRIAMEHLGRIRCEAGPGGRFIFEVPLMKKEGQDVIV